MLIKIESLSKDNTEVKKSIFLTRDVEYIPNYGLIKETLLEFLQPNAYFLASRYNENREVIVYDGRIILKRKLQDLFSKEKMVASELSVFYLRGWVIIDYNLLPQAQKNILKEIIDVLNKFTK